MLYDSSLNQGVVELSVLSLYSTANFALSYFHKLIIFALVNFKVKYLTWRFILKLLFGSIELIKAQCGCVNNDRY